MSEAASFSCQAESTCHGRMLIIICTESCPVDAIVETPNAEYAVRVHVLTFS